MQNVFIVSTLFMVFALGLGAQAQTISTFAGGGPVGAGSTAAPIGTPWGVVQDVAGNTYVSDTLTDRIFKIDTGGNLSVIAGTGVRGPAAVSPATPLATAAALNAPEGLAIDNSIGVGVLYIADSGNNVIRAVNLSPTTPISLFNISVGPLEMLTVVGNGQTCTSPGGLNTCGDGLPAAQAQLTSPAGVAVDGSENIFIADTTDNAVRKVPFTSGVITTVAGNGQTCASPGGLGTCGDGSSATLAQVTGPSGVAVDVSGNIFIADTVDNEIREVTIANGDITTVAGTGHALAPKPGPATSSPLNTPTGVAVDSAGDLFITDTLNNFVEEIPFGTGNLAEVAGDGSPCTPTGLSSCGDGPTATIAELNSPMGIFVCPCGATLLFADQVDNAVRKVVVNPTGSIAAFAGEYFNQAYYGDLTPPGAATSAQLFHPSGMNFDSAGDLFVADAQNGVIRKIDTAGKISKVAGCIPSVTSPCPGGDGPLAQASLAVPSDVAFDAAGNIYIADTQDDAIRVINTQTSDITLFAGTTDALVVHPNYIATVAGTLSTACPTPSAVSCGDGAASRSAFLNNPGGLFLDKSGNIYIADTGDNVIRFVNMQTAPVTVGSVTIQPGDIGAVAGNYTVNGSTTTACQTVSSAGAATLNAPSSVFLDTAGNIYVVDSGDNCVRVVNPQTDPVTIAGVTISAGDIATIAGSGTPGYRGDGFGATAAELDSPTGVFVVGSYIFIADEFNSVVREVNSLSGNIQTVVGTNVPGFSGDGGPAFSAELGQPMAVRGDSAGNVYISDAAAGRIRKVTNLFATTVTASVSPSILPFGNQAVGTTSAAETVTVTNNANLTNLAVSSVAITGTNTADFKQTNNCTTVAPGTACTITVTFAPTAAGARSATLTVTDNATGSPQTVALTGTAEVPFTLPTTGALSPSSVAAGKSATGTVAVTWSGSSTTTVTLSCAVTPAQTNGPTCSLSPSTVTPKNGTASSTLTVSTTAPTTSSGALQPSILHGQGSFAATCLFLPAMVLSTAGLGAKKRKALMCLLLTLAIAGCIFLVACGGGSSSSNNNGGGGSEGTPSGNYTINVTATATGVTPQTQAFQLTVTQ